MCIHSWKITKNVTDKILNLDSIRGVPLYTKVYTAKQNDLRQPLPCENLRMDRARSGGV